METFTSMLQEIEWNAALKTGIRVFVILILAWIVQFILKFTLNRLERKLVLSKLREGEPPSESEKRVQTLMRLVRQGVYLSMWLSIALVILSQVGINIGPILAGAGILGLAVGFGAQNLVRDIISGFFIILENQVRIGDVAIINGTGGLVEEINFRTMVLRDLEGVVHVFPNGAITTLSNMTQEWSAWVFELGVDYKENPDRVIAVIRNVTEEMRNDDVYGPLILEEAEIMGLERFSDSAMVIKGRIKTKPIRQWFVGREFNRRIKHAFDANGIGIPFPHRTLFFGEKSRPFEMLYNNTGRPTASQPADPGAEENGSSGSD